MAPNVHPGQVAGTRWDANLYLRFSDQRLRPALELLHRVPLESPSLIYDLGCGTGNVTRIIAERWPTARVYGIDNSKEMLEKAAAVPAAVQWTAADIEHWQPHEPPDLIYSNAALHWVPDHPRLFPRLAGWLKPGGCLAVQMPLNWGAPSHRLMRETLANGGPNGTAFGTQALRHAVGREWVAGAETYFDLLSGSGGSVDIWETEYLQVLDGNDAVVERMKGTSLRPVLMDLDDRERGLFLAEYLFIVALV